MDHNYNPELLERIATALPIDGITLPAPLLPPAERLRRRLAFRNERNLHRGISALSGKPLLTTFAPTSNYKVIDQDEWWSDAWDPHEFALPVDLTLPFFSQFLALSRAIPHCALRTSRVENSHYTNYSLNLKDCYLVYGVSDLERCMYSRAITNCRDVVDALVANQCELCYEIVACEQCYSTLYSGYCSGCSECRFCWNCRSCTDCFLCTGLERAQYCINNKPVGKEAYLQFMERVKNLSHQEVALYAEKLLALRNVAPPTHGYQRNSEECTGDFLINCARCEESNDLFNCEDGAYLSWLQKAHYSHDCTLAVPDGVQFCYQCCSTTGCKTSMGLFSCWNCSDSFYSMECNSCHHLFGCVGLRNKEYCILNRQYSPQEYTRIVTTLVAQLVARKEWGEFFPAHCSWYGYNQTIAQEYQPFSKQQAQRSGYNWYEEPVEKTPSVAHGDTVPRDSLIRVCVLSGLKFKLIEKELRFYQQLHITPPLIHPDLRHRMRIERRNP